MLNIELNEDLEIIINKFINNNLIYEYLEKEELIYLKNIKNEYQFESFIENIIKNNILSYNVLSEILEDYYIKVFINNKKQEVLYYLNGFYIDKQKYEYKFNIEKEKCIIIYDLGNNY